MSISTPERLAPRSTKPPDRTSHDSAHDPSERRSFTGWRWMAVWLAFPVAEYIGWGIGGRVEAVDAALVGGAITGAGLGAVEWWAAKGALGRAAAWQAGELLRLAVIGRIQCLIDHASAARRRRRERSIGDVAGDRLNAGNRLPQPRAVDDPHRLTAAGERLGSRHPRKACK